MKLSVILILIFVFINCFCARSQVMPHVGVLIESTVAGTFDGVYAGIHIGRRLSIGTFYERRLNRFESKFSENYYLAGLYGSWMFLINEKVSLSVILRGGFYNKQFLLVVPSFGTTIKVAKRINVIVASTYRAESPSVGLGLTVNLTKAE